MGNDMREFVADSLWLLIGIVTFVLISLAGVAGIEALAGVIAIIGWFLLVPIFLFWGDEMATLLLGPAEEETEMYRTTEADRERGGAREDDPLEELKRRYAAGEVDDAEFEHRLERLLAVDDVAEHLAEHSNGRSTGTATADPGDRSTVETESPAEDDVLEGNTNRELE